MTPRDTPIRTAGFERRSSQSVAAMRALVRERARALLADARRAFPDWTPPPFNPLVYAKLLGIPVKQTYRPMGWDALLVPVGRSFHIICDASVQSQGRRRFSIAHELVHTFFDNASKSYQMRTAGKDHLTDAAWALERLCDEGAAELIMPEKEFGNALSRMGLHATAIPELAEVFRVSLEAVALRAVELQKHACAVGFFAYTHRPSVERAARGVLQTPEEPREYRARRIYRTGGFPFLFPEGKSVPRTSIIARAALGQEALRGREWFSLGRMKHLLEVEAHPIWRHPAQPPTVCAIFRPCAA